MLLWSPQKQQNQHLIRFRVPTYCAFRKYLFYVIYYCSIMTHVNDKEVVKKVKIFKKVTRCVGNLIIEVLLIFSENSI